MSAPRATMRLQFHAGFTFAQAKSLVPYFASLGISHLYASPIMTARPGSLHGYDTIDASRVNPELGGEAELQRLVSELRRHDLGLIVDIVPNHMAVGSGNAWWMDVLARGRASRYAKYFDIDWTPSDPQLHDKLLLPILGRPYGEALAAGEISVRIADDSRPSIHYFDHEFPVAEEFTDLVSRDAIREFSADTLAGRERLHNLLEKQNYRLAWWKCANDKINWRRFFDINELAAIRVEDEDVFDAVHATIFRLYAEGLLDGVRVDHIDGLSRPGEYCRRLRARLRDLEKKRPAACPHGPAYFVVEKILAHDEQLALDWETDGTTGYDFMNEISALLHDGGGEQPLTAVWQRLSNRSGDFKLEETRARREILQRSFSSQLEATLDVLAAIAQSDLATRDISRSALRRCLTEILVHFPVYRIYAHVGERSEADARFLSRAIECATHSCLPSDKWLVRLLGRWLGGERINPQTDALQNIALTRFEQLSAPLSAKAVEDTAFYRYGALLSRNDVGFDPSRLASSALEFHQHMQARRRDFPDALLATATHDHKRGEDVRARLATLSEIADEWARTLNRWIALSDAGEPGREGEWPPDAADRAMLFQTLVAAWPMGLSPTNRDGMTRFAERINAWQRKSLREAKLHSDWSAPDGAYETTAAEFTTWLLHGPSPLLTEIADFARRISAAGAANGLAQVLTKLATPGVPDIYQGTEFWDLSLVDPDNRMPVDFAARQQSMRALQNVETICEWTSGDIKQLLIARSLAARKQFPDLFARGDYVALRTEGVLAAHVMAFARVLDSVAAIAAFCRHPMRLLDGKDSLAISQGQWEDTCVILPRTLHNRKLVDVLTCKCIAARDARLEAGQILCEFPVTLLLSAQQVDR